MKIGFIADFYKNELLGGGECNDDNLIKFYNTIAKVQCFKSKEASIGDLKHLDFIVVANKESKFHAWINEEPICKEPVIVATITGENAKKLENKSDEEVAQIALNELKAVYGNKVSELDSYFVSKWSLDPYVFGSYSTNKVGENNQLLRKNLSTPVNSKLFFAGEATSVKIAGYLQMALQSGLREAENIKKIYPN